jgi:outer membrane protein, multidrug efflux system
MTRIRTRRACLPTLACALVLGGCNLGPRYVRPALDVPASFRESAGAGAPTWPSPDWWQQFGSPQLDQLIAEAEAHNQSLAAAIAQVREADAAAQIAGSPLLPTVTANISASYTREGISHRSSSGFATSSSGGSHFLDIRSYSLTPDASYEVDFWGKNRAAYEAAEATALGSRFNQQVVQLTVVTSVATTYFDALGFSDQLAVARQNLAAAEQVLQAVQGQLAAGTASLLDVSQQQALVDGLRASIPPLQSDMTQAVIGLGILVGRPPEEITLEEGSLDRLPVPVVTPGLPSDLLARRPDVALAEADLVAQNGNVRVARAAFFPAITLTSTAGYQSTALSTLFSPSTSILSLTGNVAQTIFDNGLLTGQYKQQRAKFDELAADYRQTVLQAFTDVENALTALRYTTEQEALQRRAVESAQRALDISRAQLEAGTVNIITVLNTQTTLFADTATLEQVRLARFSALINLYKALGGGWSLPPTGAAS